MANRMRLITARGRLTEVARKAIQEEIRSDLHAWGKREVVPYFEAVVDDWKHQPEFTTDVRKFGKDGEKLSFGIRLEGDEGAKMRWRVVDTGRKGGALILPTKVRYDKRLGGNVTIPLNVVTYHPRTKPVAQLMARGGRRDHYGIRPVWWEKVEKVTQGKVKPRKFTEIYLQKIFREEFYKVVDRAYERVRIRIKRAQK